MRLAVTGHAELSAQAAEMVKQAVTPVIQNYAGLELRGITCLCHGADLIFARAVLAASGRLEAVIPSRDYRSVVPPEHARDYDELVALAVAVRQMPFAHPSREAYRAASMEMLSRSDRLIAIWDGSASRALGDTADVVAAARRVGLPVEVVWPRGATRMPRR